MATTALREKFQNLYFGDGPEARRFRYGLVGFDLATIGLFSIVSHWNEWFGGLIYLRNPSMYPLQTYLRGLLRDLENILRMAGGDYAQILRLMNARTGRSAQLFLAMVPVLVVYPFLQRYFTTGLVLGSVKG